MTNDDQVCFFNVDQVKNTDDAEASVSIFNAVQVKKRQS